MTHRILCLVAAPLALASSGLHAKQSKVVWPSTATSVEGKWYAERSEAAIEIVGNRVYLRRSSEPARRLYMNLGPGSVIATLNNDFVPKGDAHTNFTATCNERGGVRKCGGFVNYPIAMRKTNPKYVVRMTITIGDSDRFLRFEDLDADLKAKHKVPV